MSIVVKFKVSGMSADKYDKVMSQLDAVGAGAPPGRLFHVSYGERDSVQVIDVYDSPQSLEKFGKQLVPILEKMGVKAEPEVHDAVRIVKG